MGQVTGGGQTLETEGAVQVRGGVAWGGARVQETEELLVQGGGVAWWRGGEVRTEVDQGKDL